jgi:DNA-binding NarL/FixJ family response regulator
MTSPSLAHCEIARRSAAGIHVSVVSDDRLYVQSLVHLLAAEPDLIVSACETTARPLSEAALAYDVVLLDVRALSHWPHLGAIPESAVVILVGAPDDDEWAGGALSAGARGILTRTANSADVVGAIRVAHEGGIWARRRWLNACVLRIVGDARRTLVARDAFDACLTRREQEVLRHAATGISNKELARILDISEATVKVHLTRIFLKLGVSSRAALTAVYHENGGRTTNDVL